MGILFNRNETAKNENAYKDRELKRLNAIAEDIERLTTNYENISEQDFLARTNNLKNRLSAGKNINDLLPEAFALASAAIHRKCGFKPHRVQLMGAISIFEGSGVEMKTGEGKTITAILPAYLNALTGDPVHIMTSNDYLAKRDAETVQPVFNLLGLSVGSIDASLSRDDKRLVYQSDVVYGTTANFGFDFLRDNLVYRQEDKFTRGLGFAVIDEADSLLLDQARTPLILSESEQVSAKENELFQVAAKFAESLTIDDVEIDEEKKSAVLGASGVDKAEQFFGMDFNMLFDEHLYYINNAVTAKFALENDKDYIVANNRVVLIDQNTARPLPTHRFSEGLHQAVEAKEHLQINPESKVLGKITIQNFLRKYKKISGMSGTIKTSEEEMRAIYGLDVIQIPTNKPVARKDDTRFYFYGKEKYEAIVRDVLETHKKGQPILIGTISIEESEMLHEMLKQVGIDCAVLNAKNLDEEAKIVANAGRLGAVTIATDMAGRGTDIKLGGNASVLAELAERAGSDITLEEIKKETKMNRERVIAAGGLKVIGSSLHELVRVDDQLRGRAGRQGEIGESVFYTSLDDEFFDNKPEVKEVLRSDFVKYMVSKNERVKEKILQKFEKIQEINESIDFGSRKNMLVFDQEPSKQYEEFYKLRNEILQTSDISQIILNGAECLAEQVIDSSINASRGNQVRDENYLKHKSIYNRFNFDGVKFEDMTIANREIFIKKLSSKIMGNLNGNMINGIGKTKLLKNMDEAFMDHLKNIEMLKKDLMFGSIGDNNPKLTFEEKAHTMYNEMIDSILPEVVSELLDNTPKQFNFGRFAAAARDIQNQQTSKQ